MLVHSFSLFIFAATSSAPVMTSTIIIPTTPCIDGMTQYLDECHNSVCVGGKIQVALACNKNCGPVSKFSWSIFFIKTPCEMRINS